MKRIKCIVALVAMVGIFSAQAAEVDSVNMVGFANVNLAQGLNIVGAPFVTVGDTETTLGDLFDVADMTAGTTTGDSDSVLVYTGSGYDTYFLYAFAGPGFNETAWVNTSYVEVDVALAPGEAVWLNRFAAAADVTFKGEVVSAASTDISLSTGLNMVSYPYSISASLNDFDISNATSGTTTGDADSVLVYTGSGYDTYFLYAFAGPGFNEIAWVNTSYVEVDVDMSIGKGVWYNAMAATTGISADKPY
jgi:hypothetical protein